jgi:hypothetical protein
MVSEPPAAITVTFAVAVIEPALSVAVNVYVVVVVGLTLVEPLADTEVNVPGVILMLVAPVVFQLSVLLEPAMILAGVAVKELIAGFAEFTVTVTADVVEPEALVAVNV